MAPVNKSDKDRVIIFDTTLRDGEQCPGATMTFEEKLEVAELLDEMGVDIIEAGFPVASEGDFAAVNEIAKRTKNAVVCGLSRANPVDCHGRRPRPPPQRSAPAPSREGAPARQADPAQARLDPRQGARLKGLGGYA